LAILLHRTARDQVLQFFVRTQPEHLLASARGVSRPEILVHNIKELLKLVGGATREHRHQFLSHQIRNSPRKWVFLENSHRAETVAHFGRTNSTILTLFSNSDYVG